MSDQVEFVIEPRGELFAIVCRMDCRHTRVAIATCENADNAKKICDLMNRNERQQCSRSSTPVFKSAHDVYEKR